MSAGFGWCVGAVFERHDSDFGDSDALENVHDGNKFLNREFKMGADDDCGFGLFDFESDEAGFEVSGCDNCVIDLKYVVFIDRDIEGLRGIR